ASQTVRLHSLKPNPTRASPYSSGNRCLNLWSPQGTQPERSSNGPSRRGPTAILRGVSRWPRGSCEPPPLGRSMRPASVVSRRGLYGYSLRATRVIGDVTWRKWLFTCTGDCPTSSQHLLSLSNVRL